MRRGDQIAPLLNFWLRFTSIDDTTDSVNALKDGMSAVSSYVVEHAEIKRFRENVATALLVPAGTSSFSWVTARSGAAFEGDERRLIELECTKGVGFAADTCRFIGMYDERRSGRWVRRFVLPRSWARCLEAVLNLSL